MTVTKKVVDFTNVKDQGQFNTKRVTAGDYLAKVVKVEDAEVKSGDNKGDFQYLFTIKLVKFSQNSYPYYCKLTENQLWKLRNLLVAGGINVPKKRVTLDPTKVVGKNIGVTMEDDEYEGKEKSVIAAVFPPSDLDDYDEGDAGSSDDEAADDTAEDDEDLSLGDEEEDEGEAEVGDEFVDMDRNALKVFIKGKDDAAVFKKSETDDDLRARARAFSDDAGDEDEDLEELDISDL